MITGMSRILWRVVIGVLSALGLVLIVFNIAPHFGMLRTCMPMQQRAWASPTEGNVALVATSTCKGGVGRVDIQIFAPSRAPEHAFAGTLSGDLNVDVRWLSPSSIELTYSPNLKIEVPADPEAIPHVYNGVEVTYRSR
jgi:hypothetical protein